MISHSKGLGTLQIICNSDKRYIEQIYGEPSLELLRCQEGFLHCALALRELYCVYVGVALPGHIYYIYYII